MGADGGVIYIPLKYPSHERYNRVIALLQPFWQFLDAKGSDLAEDANCEWEKNNLKILPPNFLLGYYGTDCDDYFNIGDLENICDIDCNLNALTFDELDLECRTSTIPITGKHYEHILHRLWYKHFWYSSREEVLETLNSIASMKITDWTEEIRELLDLNRIFREETWT